MKVFFKSALITCFLALLSSAAMADAKLDEMLAAIDADISAKRLSNPAGNNAIEKIWQFKAIAPYDQRINSRAYDVGVSYVALASKSTSAKKYSKAQLYLDKAWMLAYLTPGLEAAQDSLDSVYKGGRSVVAAKKTKVAKKAAPKKAKKVAKKAKPKKVAKVDKKKAAAAAKAKRKKELAAAKQAKKQAAKEAKAALRAKEEKERALALQRKEMEAKRQAAEKLATLNAQRALAQAALAKEQETRSIADFDLNQDLIDNRETREIRSALMPICQEILDNEASVVLHTRNTRDYRWLTVRLTLCVRRIDKSFRLRHSYKQVADGEPSISLHPGRNVSLLNRNRG
jgi:colicin import membrane protein